MAAWFGHLFGQASTDTALNRFAALNLSASDMDGDGDVSMGGPPPPAPASSAPTDPAAGEYVRAAQQHRMRQMAAVNSAISKAFTGQGGQQQLTGNFQLFKNHISSNAKLLGVVLDDDDWYNIVIANLDGQPAVTVNAMTSEGQLQTWRELDPFLSSDLYVAPVTPFTERRSLYEKLIKKLSNGKAFKRFVLEVQQRLPTAAAEEKISLCMGAVPDSIAAQIGTDPSSGKFWGPDDWDRFTAYAVPRLEHSWTSSSQPSSSKPSSSYPSSSNKNHNRGRSSSRGRRSTDGRGSSRGADDRDAKRSRNVCPACNMPGHTGPRSVDANGNYVCKEYVASKNPQGLKIYPKGGGQPAR